MDPKGTRNYCKKENKEFLKNYIVLNIIIRNGPTNTSHPQYFIDND